MPIIIVMGVIEVGSKSILNRQRAMLAHLRSRLIPRRDGRLLGWIPRRDGPFSFRLIPRRDGRLLGWFPGWDGPLRRF
jgi:Ser/Thr protein kinase RdoA (MazF antagonist)